MKVRCCAIVLIAICVILLAPVAMAEASTWSKVYQASCYGPYEGETITATGKRITSKTRYVAVPRNRIVKKSKWKKLSKTNKKLYFYYHEKIKLRHGRYKVTAYIEDCGGFGSYGTYRKGKWVKRMFDLTPAVFKDLHIHGVGFVEFKYC